MVKYIIIHSTEGDMSVMEHAVVRWSRVSLVLEAMAALVAVVVAAALFRSADERAAAAQWRHARAQRRVQATRLTLSTRNYLFRCGTHSTTGSTPGLPVVLSL